MPWSPYALGTGMLLSFDHGWSCHCVLLEQEEKERYYGLGMDSPVPV